MCGLIAYLGTDEQKKEVEEELARETVMDQYEEQHTRGQRGFGVLTVENGLMKVRRATEPVKMFFDLNRSLGRFIMLHHRLPTSTDNMLTQTHPIIVPPGKYETGFAVMHNGVISNSTELRKAHEELGYEYSTLHMAQSSYYQSTETEKFNDSEALAIEFARFMRGDIEKIGAYGSAALIVLEFNKQLKPVAFHYGRNEGNPLYQEDRVTGTLIASEADGVLIEPFVLNSHKMSGDLFGEFSSRDLPFATRPAVSSTYTASPYYRNERQQGQIGFHTSHPALPPTTEKKDEPEIRVSMFDDPTSEQALAYYERMNECMESGFDAVRDACLELGHELEDGTATKTHLTQTMKQIAAILNGLITYQGDLEKEILQETSDLIMEEIREDADSRMVDNWHRQHTKEYGEGHSYETCNVRFYHPVEAAMEGDEEMPGRLLSVAEVEDVRYGLS